MSQFKYKPAAAGAILLDFSKGYSARSVVSHLRNGCGMECPVIEGLADRIEAQIKPARIPEPGLWGVVEAPNPATSSGYVWQWVHHPKDVWLNAEGESAKWDDLLDLNPRLVREGLS